MRVAKNVCIKNIITTSATVSLMCNSIVVSEKMTSIPMSSKLVSQSVNTLKHLEANDSILKTSSSHKFSTASGYTSENPIMKSEDSKSGSEYVTSIESPGKRDSINCSSENVCTASSIDLIKDISRTSLVTHSYV